MADDLKETIKNELLELAMSKRDSKNEQGFADYISRTGEMMKNSKTIHEFFSFEEKRDLAKSYLHLYYNSYVEEPYITVPRDIN